MNDYVNIKQKDDRGVYICVTEDGMRYLYQDGVVRTGVGSKDSTAFWPSMQEATDFYEEWKNNE